MTFLRSLSGERPRSPDLTPADVRDEAAREIERQKIILASIDATIAARAPRWPDDERRRSPR